MFCVSGGDVCEKLVARKGVFLAVDAVKEERLEFMVIPNMYQ